MHGSARLLRGRLDPGTATGLALTLALGVAILGGLLVGALAYLMRSSGYLVSLDASVGEWGCRPRDGPGRPAAAARHRPREHSGDDRRDR